jgi:hypothetical protein
MTSVFGLSPVFYRGGSPVSQEAIGTSLALRNGVQVGGLYA